jgi:HEAT repeat protein
MSVAPELLVIVAPLRLTLWVLAIATAVILVLIAIGVSRHVESIRAERRRRSSEALNHRTRSSASRRGFGIAAIAATHGAAVYRLAEVLASDPDARVRAAASSALGIAGGGNAPAALVAATTDPEVQVRRAAVRALGFFDDPTTGDALEERTEDDDREVALRAAEALVALARRPRAGSEVRARLESSSAWAVKYARTVAEVSA